MRAKKSAFETAKYFTRQTCHPGRGILKISLQLHFGSPFLGIIFFNLLLV